MAIQTKAQAQVEIIRRLFTADEYERMIAVGILREAERVELIRGEIIEMAPINLSHASCVARLTMLFSRRLSKISGTEQAIVWAQNPIYLSDSSRPQPDVALLKWRDDVYAGKPPLPQDVLLLIEVSDTSLRYDRSVKLPLYAEAGVAVSWIVNLQGETVEVYRSPENGVYQETQTLKRGEKVSLPEGLGKPFNVDDVLG